MGDETEVIRRLVRETEESPSVSLDVLLRVSLGCMVAGSLVVVVALSAFSVPWLILGFLVLSAGCCLATLEALLAPERPDLSVRAVRAVHGFFVRLLGR